MQTADLVMRQLPEEVILKDLGEHRLKGMQWLEHLYQVCVPDLPQEFPSLATTITHPNNLPLQLTSFIGREKETSQVAAMLQDHRLLTLTGSGGVGKTRLALQVAAQVLEGYPNGAWLVELAPLADPALAPKTAASALGVPETAGRAILDSLVDYLRQKHLLLILDNCEHLLSACANLADKIPEMIAWRDRVARELGLELVIGQNVRALAEGMHPSRGRIVCCTALKTEPLQQVLEEHRFTGIIAGIRRDGLRAMSRDAVHLSPDHETAVRVGARRGEPVVLVVDAAAMHTEGHAFRVSANGVWLVDRVPADRLCFPG